jgi:hypothetical protein
MTIATDKSSCKLQELFLNKTIYTIEKSGTSKFAKGHRVSWKWKVVGSKNQEADELPPGKDW